MTSFAERPEMQFVLTLLFVFQLFGAVKPIVWNRYFKLVMCCALLGATLVQYVLVMSLYGVYHSALPSSLAQSESGGRVVPLMEFLSLNVTMTSLYACGFATMLIVTLGLVGRWLRGLAVDAAECLPYLTGGDHVARTVPDLRNKIPMK
jgi:hypothetical protein